MATAVTKGARVTGADRTRMTKEFVRRYKGGESIRAIMADSGRSYGSIQKLLVESGVEMRSRGGATRGAAAKASARKGTAKKASPAKAATKAPAKKAAAAARTPARKATAKKSAKR